MRLEREREREWKESEANKLKDGGTLTMKTHYFELSRMSMHKRHILKTKCE